MPLSRLCLLLKASDLLKGRRFPFAGPHGLLCTNANFLWDGIGPEDGSSQVEFPWRNDPDAAREHMQKVVQVIRKADADIVLLHQ